MNVLTQRLRLAADYLEEHGWVQGAELENGRVCLTGAVRYCAPQTGDEYLIRAVLRHRETAESWNDALCRTEGDVLDLLRTAEITDTDLAEVFGPNWNAIVRLVRQVASLTPAQATALATAWNASWNASWNADGNAAKDAAWNAAWNAARDAILDEALDAARDAILAADLDADLDAALDADLDSALDAIRGLVVRGLIGSEHFAVLYGPWASVFGWPDEA